MFRFIVIMVIGWFIYHVIRKTGFFTSSREGRKSNSPRDKKSEVMRKIDPDDIEDAEFKDID